MVVRAAKLTPEVLISAPRHSAAVPSPDGKLALYTKSAYSFDTKKTTKELRVLNIESGESHTLDDGEVHDASWIPGTNQIIWIADSKKGNSDLIIYELDNKKSYKMDTIEAPFKDLRMAQLDDGIAITFSGWADYKGSLYNKEIADRPASTGQVYDNNNVRFWDTYRDPINRNVIWYSKMVKDKKEKWELAAPVHNALKGTDLESPFPYDPLNPNGGYDISSSGIIFSAFDPASDPINVISDVYFVPLKSFTEEKAPTPRKLVAPGSRGLATNAKLSACGKHALFLLGDQNRQWNTRLMFIPDITKSTTAIDLIKSANQPWDIIPSGAEWAKNGKEIYVTAATAGRTSLFSVSLTSGRDLAPRQLTDSGVVTGFHELGDSGRLLVSSTSMTDPMTWTILDSAAPSNTVPIFSASHYGSKLGISRSQVSEIYFEGGGDYCVQAWVVKPPNFDASKKYPLAFLMHGGPEAAWEDAWSVRWNPMVWAAQGYVCVLPNPSGSVGFGLDFIEAVYNSWGGRPYDDLVKCFEYVRDNLDYVDTQNAVAAGGSYGGYLANWIQGQPLGREFKAIVCHDGVFNTLQTGLASDSIAGHEDFGGPTLPWINYENINRYNPARPDLLANWGTPMLVIHSQKDYRCIVSDGLAAFATCQAKGIRSRYLTFPDEGHWVLKPENSLHWHKTVFDWVNEYSGITAKKNAEARAAEVAMQAIWDIESERLLSR